MNKFVCFGAAFAMAVVSMSFAHADTVAWWHFDECDPGTTAPANTIASETTSTQYAEPWTIGSKSNWSDSTKNGGAYLPVFTNPFHGPVVYDPVTGATRTNRAAMKFTTARGGDSPNDYSGRAWWGGMLMILDGKTLYSTCTRSITVEAFVCTTGGVFNTFAPIVASVVGTDFTNEKWAIYMEADGTISLRFNATPYYSGTSQAGTSKINDGAWHHVAFTWDGSTVKVFVDYKQDKFSNGAARQFSNSSTISYGDDNRTRIGGYPYYNASGSRKFNGLVDEVRVSNVALTPDDFLRLKESAADDDDTVLHLRFDSDSARALVDGEIVGERVGGPQAIYYAVSGSDASTLDTAEKAGDKVSVGIYAGASSVADTASFCQSTNASGKANYIKAANATNPLFPDGAPEVTNLNYTVEAFFKTKGKGQLRQNVLKFGTDFRPAQFVMGDEAHSHQLQFGYNKGASHTWANDSPYTPADRPCDDGNWHHVAFVSDASNNLVRAYYDYELVSTQTGVYLPVRKTYSLFVGSSENGGGQFFDGWIDDVRVTKRVLDRDEFLTTHPVGSATQPLFTALLEQNYNFVCVTDSYWTVTGVGAARSGGTAPVFEKTSSGALFLDGTNGTVKVTNEWSANMNRSNIVFPSSLLYEQDAYTIEFWAKFTGYSDSDGARGRDATLTEHAGILRFAQGDTTTFDWYMFRHKEYADCIQFVVREANNNLNYNITWSLPNLIADGKWHHYAVEFASNAGNTSADITLYYDYESMGTKSANGIFRGSSGHRLMVCESSGANANILGNIDAIRFWRGNPDPSQFLSRAKSGFVLIIR